MRDQVTEHPCALGLTEECFRRYPKWAKQAFAVRVINMLTPRRMRHMLPRGLGQAFIMPGVEVPPGMALPPGTVVAPDTVFPPGWSAGDPLPSGATTPGALPPGVDGTGATPPLYVEPWSLGPGSTTSATTPVTSPVDLEGSVNDCWIYKTGPVWADLIAATSGGTAIGNQTAGATAISAVNNGTDFTVTRSFFEFDVSCIPAGSTIIDAELYLTGYGNEESTVMAFKGSQSSPPTGDDIHSFDVEVSYSRNLWIDTERHLSLTHAGEDYIQSMLSGTVKFCCREWDHDVIALAPGAAQQIRNGCYFQESERVKRPHLKIWFT